MEYFMMSKKSQVDFRVVIAGIVALAAIEICALFNDINGTLMTIVIAVIAGAIGIAIPTNKVLK
jgi:hypothetical protein